MKERNKGISLSYIFFVVNTVLTIIVSALIVRSVGQTDYGVYQTVTAFASYLVLLEFGTGAVMTRNLSMLQKNGTDTEEVDKNVSTIWSLTLILSIAIAILSTVFYFSISSIYKNSLTLEQISIAKELFIFVAINLIFSFFTHTLNGLILGYEYYTYEKIVALSRLIIRSILIAVLMFINPSIKLIVVLDSIITVFIFLLTLAFCVVKLKAKLVFKYFDKQVFKAITPFCLAMLLQMIVNTANYNADKFLISIMMTPEDVSVYAIAMTLFTMYSSVGCIPLSMYTPQIARNMKNGMQGEELTKSLIQPSRLNTLILGVLAVGIFVVGKPFLVIIYGASYAQSWIYALIVIIPMYFGIFNGVIISVVDVMNKRHIRSLVLLLTTIFNVIATILGIKYIGMIGASIATGVSLTLQTIILNVYYYKKLNINTLELFVESFKGIMIFLLIAGAVAFALTYVITNIYLQFFVCGSVFCILFFLLFILFGTNQTEKDMLVRIKDRILKKNN